MPKLCRVFLVSPSALAAPMTAHGLYKKLARFSKQNLLRNVREFINENRPTPHGFTHGGKQLCWTVRVDLLDVVALRLKDGEHA